MSLEFLVAYGKHKLTDTLGSVMVELVKRDPAGMSAADIDVELHKLDGLGIEIQGIGRQHEESLKALNEALKTNNQRLHGVEILQGRLAAAQTQSERTSLENSINTMLSTLESAQTELDELKAAEQDLKTEFQEYNTIYDDRVKDLRSRKADLEKAAREVKSAERQNEIAHERAKRAEQLSGLKSTTGGTAVDTALKAMNERRDKLKDEAAALNRRATVLTPTRPEEDDPNIKAALAQASNTPITAPTSAADRLAKLKDAQQQRAAG